MSDYIVFWLSKYLADALIVLLVIFAIATGCLLAYLPILFRQLRCKHQSFRETSACDAICNNCGANLGFIENLRSKQS